MWSEYRAQTIHDLKVLSIIIIIGLIVRIALVIFVSPYPERYIQADAVKYDRLAINLISGNGYSIDSAPPYTPENFRVPGYPVTLASVYYLLGYSPAAILWIQAILGTITIFLTYLFGTKIYSARVGLISAAFLAFSPISITYSALLWSDTEYAFVFLLSIILTFFMLVNMQIKYFFMAGLLTGIAVLIHPRSLYLPYLISLLLVGMLLYKRIPVKKILIYTFVYLLTFNLILFPWRLRNYLVFGVPNVSSAGGINMLYYGAALTESAQTGEDQWSIIDQLNSEVETPGTQPLNKAELGDMAFKLGLQKISQSPLTYAKVHFIGMLKIFLPGTNQINTLITGQSSFDLTKIYGLFTSGSGDNLSEFVRSLYEYPLQVWIFIVFEIIFLACIYSLAIYGIIKQGRSQPWLWFILLILLYLAFVAGPAGAPRFRVVMMPFLCVLAAYGLVSINSISRKMDQWLKSPQ